MPPPVLDYSTPTREPREFPSRGLEVSLATLCFMVFILCVVYMPSGTALLTPQYAQYLRTQGDLYRANPKHARAPFVGKRYIYPPWWQKGQAYVSLLFLIVGVVLVVHRTRKDGPLIS